MQDQNSLLAEVLKELSGIRLELQLLREQHREALPDDVRAAMAQRVADKQAAGMARLRAKKT